MGNVQHKNNRHVNNNHGRQSKSATYNQTKTTEEKNKLAIRPQVKEDAHVEKIKMEDFNDTDSSSDEYDSEPQPDNDQDIIDSMMGIRMSDEPRPWEGLDVEKIVSPHFVHSVDHLINV